MLWGENWKEKMFNQILPDVNPIPVELWNDLNRQGRAIMARIEFLPQI